MVMMVNKSLTTNLVSAGLILAGIFSPVASDHIFTVGLFATSGAVTNWLAVHMLFERVPGLYGSGVIPNRFEEIKRRIHRLIMEQFFNHENVSGFFNFSLIGNGRSLDPGPIVDAIDYDRVYDRLVDIVLDTTMGGLLGMVVGASAFEPLRAPFQLKMKEEIFELLTSQQFEAAVAKTMEDASLSDDIIEKVEQLILNRLDQLTPEMIKRIIQDMIQEHLGWLVVWGGVFGGAIGVVAGFAR